jgi:class 3 adenylate cyclase/CHASE2 domain-containing sensor protein
MISIQRRQFLFTCIRIVLLTLVAVALDWGGHLLRLEHAIYDFRAVHCQEFEHAPTDRLVHLDIDETTLDQVGRFPWDRNVMAEILEEIRLTRPKVLAMDILFPEPKEVSYKKNGDVVDQDAIMSEEIKKFGRVLIPCSLTFQPAADVGAMEDQTVRLLFRDPELTADEVIAGVSATGISPPPSSDDVRHAFLALRPRAMFERIHSELAAGLQDRAALRQKMLPHTDPLLTGTVLGRLFDEQYERVLRERALVRFTMPIPKGIPPVLRATDEITPILPISRAAAYSGFVDYLPDHLEGTVRSVPLFADYRNHLMPQMGLAAACAMLDVDVNKLQLGRDTVTIPCPDGRKIVIPVSSRPNTDAGAVSFLMEVPMFGKKNGYFTMYDYPKHEVAAQHVSVYAVWQVCQARRRLEANQLAADGVLADARKLAGSIHEVFAEPDSDEILAGALKLTDPDAATSYLKAPLRGEAKKALITKTLDDMSGLAKGLSEIPPADLGDNEKQLLKNLKLYDGQLREVLKGKSTGSPPDNSISGPARGNEQRQLIVKALDDIGAAAVELKRAPEPGPKIQEFQQELGDYTRQLREIVKQDDALEVQLDQFRGELRRKLNGRALFLGGVATSLLDLRPTSLDFGCPGIVIHGAIFNAIMTGKMWRVAPRYVAWIITIVAGLLTGLLVSTFSPLRAFLGSAVLIGGYLAFNGYVLFDMGNLIVGAAGPLVAVSLVWSGVTLTDFILEISERNRITKRFRSYVDPALVNWVLDHPEQTRFDGEIREMTMAFSDLESFTTLTENLGEKAVQLLSDYMGWMVPVVRANRGYVAKQIGDGLFFFFGAPEPDPQHAIHGVKTILEMQDALARFNLTLPARGLPKLIMRLGVSTGKVVIGDAGPSDASDYTALGDSVNLASRMEAANKVFGTYNMITERTVSLLEGAFLVRPIAILRVKGKTLGVPVFEPLCPIDAVTPEKQKLADCTTEMVGAFKRGEFTCCIEAADKMEAAFGHSKLISLYRNLSQTYLTTPPEHFDGQVVLTEK